MAAPNALASIINSQWPYIQAKANGHQIRHLNAVRICRTSALGGQLYACNSCKAYHYRYNSCRNRHCSQCQNTQKLQWIEAQKQKVLPVEYFHVVFTIPDQVNTLCLAYPRQLYSILFKACWHTLDRFGWDHKYLGAQLGATMVLHTWGSNLSFHPHVHCVVPGGGVAWNGKWKPVKNKGKFLFPVQAMSAVFKGKFLAELKEFCKSTGLDDAQELFKELYAKKWVVFAKNSTGNSEAVIKYLARYTHNIAISHHRIQRIDDQEVVFSYKDYRQGGKQKSMRLTAQEFVKRFMLHILPHGFTRIRHYGILSSQWRSRLFKVNIQALPTWQNLWQTMGLNVARCPACKTGNLVWIKEIRPARGPPISSNPPTKPLIGRTSIC